ncbi:MAG TPA: cytochrome c peroxidase [Flavisolibacter sp.]|nr:cytochrome c peroxidase [Flavisolibacter sp.]
MKKFLILLCLGVTVLASQLPGCSHKPIEGITAVKNLTARDIDGFVGYLSDSLLPLAKAKAPAETLRPSFLRARILYKRAEWALEYFMPTTTRFINGPPLPEVENEENKIKDPEGLQVIEAAIYTEDAIDYEKLQVQIRLLLANAKYCERYWSDLELDSTQVFDAVKLQVFRIISLGISGFDAALAKSSLPEAASSLSRLEEVLGAMGAEEAGTKLFQNAVYYLNSYTDFDNFDRLLFIKEHAQPLSAAIVAHQVKLGLPFIKDLRLLKPSATSLFDKDAFDVNAYVQDSSFYFTAAKSALGKRLFYDPVLSKNNQRSCASCHQPGKAFSDGLPKSQSLSATDLKRNTPTLLNAALQPWQFYDMRTTNLENQAMDVISNKDEMHGNLEASLGEITKNADYLSLLQKAFPGKKGFTESDLRNALASYVRSLGLLNSRFDRYMRGENAADLTAEEKNGFNLFMGKAKCGTCHFMPLFNGTVPPAFIKMESEVIGVPSAADKASIDEDPGRYAIYRLQPYLHAFKTTTVRNTAMTGPYMHNGIFTTLDEVIEFYNKGGGAGMGLNVSNQTLPPEPLNLNAAEKNALIAFLRTLNDELPEDDGPVAGK